MNQDILAECITLAFAGTRTFGETLGHMQEAGVQWYLADLITGGIRHYPAAGEVCELPWPASYTAPPIADQFDEAGVIAAIRSIQARKSIFPEFLQAIAAAGVTHYTVHLGGRKAIYTGRHGQSYIEPFPSL